MDLPRLGDVELRVRTDAGIDDVCGDDVVAAERRTTALAPSALTARRRTAHQRVAGLPPVHVGAEGDDATGPLVPVHPAGRAPALDHEVQVAPAYPAEVDLHEDV